MARKIGVALVGTGNIALMHVLGYRNFPIAEIRALCDKNLARAKAFRKEANLPISTKIYKNSTECVQDDTVDLVEVLTPHSTHEAISVEACEAGKHVSVQKSPAVTLSSYDRMVAAARKAGVRFRVYEHYRYHPPYVFAIEQIRKGVIGSFGSINMRQYATGGAVSDYRGNKLGSPFYSFNWRYKEEENHGASTMFDDGYHRSSVIQAFLGDVPKFSEPITVVRAWVNWQELGNNFKMDMPAVVIYETKKADVYGTWNVSYSRFMPFHSNCFPVDEFIEISGSKGIIIINGCMGNLFVGCECGGPGKPGVYWFSRDEEDRNKAPFPEAGTWKSNCSMETDISHSFINCTQHFASVVAKDERFDENDPRPIGSEQG